MNKLQQRIKNLALTLKAVVYCLLTGKKDKVIKNPKKVVFILTAKLGDTVCVTPMLYHLKEKFKDLEIAVVSTRVNLDILKDSNLVDVYFDLESPNKTSKTIKNYNPDIIFLPYPDLGGLLIAISSGVKAIIGSKIVGGKGITPATFDLLVNFVKVVPHQMGQYAPGQYLKLLEPLGIFTKDTTKHLGFSQDAKENFDKILANHSFDQSNKLIGLSVTAGNKIKEWPIDNFVSLVNQIATKYNATFVLFGSINDKAINNLFLSKLNKDVKIIDTTGILNIDELKAGISSLDLFIAVDTGPIYIAESFGVPLVDIIGPVDENEQPPQNDKSRLVYLKDRQAPAIHIMNARNYDEKEARRQVEEITPEMVMGEVGDL